MATAQLLPIYTKLSQKILRKTTRWSEVSRNHLIGRAHVVGGNQIVEGLDRLWLALRCPSHSWTWPRANHEERLEGFDAHQTCHKCMSRRMFNSQEWHAGPVYRRVCG